MHRYPLGLTVYVGRERVRRDRYMFSAGAFVVRILPRYVIRLAKVCI
jgi:hypothetical protein